ELRVVGVAGVEVEERASAAEGEATELDVGLVEVDALAAGGAGVGRQVGVDVSADQTILGVGTGIQADVAASTGRSAVGTTDRPVVRRSAEGIETVLDTETTADAQAGLGARDVEEAGAEGVADADVVDRLRGHRKIGGMSAGSGSSSCSGAEQDALDVHF